MNPDKYAYPTIPYMGPSDYGKTPLHMAAIYDIIVEHDNKQIVKLLLSGGANINARDNKANTPLHYAAIHNNKKEMAKLLLDNGAEVNARNNAGETPLRRCCEDMEIRRLLISKGAKY